MGCHKKTQDVVKEDLASELNIAAKKKLKHDYPTSTEAKTDDLEDNLYALAAARFKDKAGYTYSSTCKPPRNKGNVVTIDKLCSLDEGGDRNELISKFITSNLLSGTDLPPWMKDNSKADLLTIIGDLLSLNYKNEWSYSEYIQTYDAAKSDEKSKKCDAVIVYANGVEDIIRGGIHIFYFIGVYYDVTSPTEQARAELQKEAYSSAQQLSKGPPITKDEELEKALAGYGTTLFKQNFNYDYTSDPPDYHSGKSATLLTRNQHLCYTQHRDARNIDSYVEKEIFTGFTIPDDVLAGVQALFKDIFKETQVGTWNYLYLDQSYELKATLLSPARANAVLLYWYGHQTVSTNESGSNIDVRVDVTYIYFMGTVYELAPDAVGQDLLRQLCHSLTGKDDDAVKGNKEKWKQDIDSAARARFRNHFNFDFEADPPDTKKDTDTKFKSCLFEFAGLPTSDEVKEQIERFQLEDTGNGFTRKGPEIYDNLLKAINYRVGPETVKDGNVWYDGFIEPQYTFETKDDTNRTIKEYAAYLYAYGKLTEDGRGGTTAERFYINWLGAFCQIDIIDDDDDV